MVRVDTTNGAAAAPPECARRARLKFESSSVRAAARATDDDVPMQVWAAQATRIKQSASVRPRLRAGRPRVRPAIAQSSCDQVRTSWRYPLRLLPAFAARNRLALLMSVKLEGPSHMDARALAPMRPSPVRTRINSRSNSASPPRTVNIRRPWAVVVSAQVSPSDLNVAPDLRRSGRECWPAQVDRASRSSRVTITRSPASMVFSSRVAAGGARPAAGVASDRFIHSHRLRRLLISWPHSARV